MAKELEPIDISNTPELVRLTEEVQRTRQPRVLQRDKQDVAVIMPIGHQGRARMKKEKLLEAQIWAGVGVDNPERIWADYDPAQVKAAFREAQGVLAGLDREKLLKDIYEAREQDTGTRLA